MRDYIWRHADWPKLYIDHECLSPSVDEVRKKQFAFLGALSLDGQEQRLQLTIDFLTTTAVDSSLIEGEVLDWTFVRSSVARRLGVDVGGVRQDDRIEGVVEMTLDAVRRYEDPLTHERLQSWHAGLFPRAVGEAPKQHMGAYRTVLVGPMRVLSGPIGRERVHFEAPPAHDVSLMMNDFLRWYDGSRDSMNGLIRAAIAHLWFLTIHPFHDGNGRIARAIADMALAQDERSGDRFYSLSAQIQKERSTYYDALEFAQRGTLDVTEWVRWFAACLGRAIGSSQDVLWRARNAALFWRTHRDDNYNDRQKKVIWRLLGDFEGDLNLRKYIAISGSPRATAQRDLTDLVINGVLARSGRGKATHYRIIYDAATSSKSAAE